MSAESVPPTRAIQVDELLAALERNATAIHRNTIAVSALAAANVALNIAVEQNTSAIENLEEEDEHDEDCDDNDCDGECLDEPEPPKRKKRRKT